MLRLRSFLAPGSRSIANSSSMRRTISMATLAPERIRNLTYVKTIAQVSA
jgi:hypothetical protein